MFFKRSPTEKAQALEKKGDRLFAKEKFSKAFQTYEKSWEWDSERPSIYPKLIESFEKLDREWTQEDFELTLSWTMRQQELENPEIKHVHEKFTPEYQEVQKLIQQFLVSPTDVESQALREKILANHELATSALLDFLQRIKENIQQDLSGKFEKEDL